MRTKEEKIKLLLELFNKGQNKTEEDIAIIGLAGKYPGSSDLHRFWDNLAQGKNCINEIPSNRWNWKKYFDADITKNDKTYSKWGGFIDDVDKFDSLFFNISPLEAEGMDPQERLFLETSWELLEDAGYTRKKLSHSTNNVGVFVGVMNCNYEYLGGEAWGNDIVTGAHSSYWSIANRISYFFDFQGPSLAVDTACSSSLTAIHLACESIKKEECDVAIAGGINLIIHPVHYIRLAKMNMLSKGNEVRAFGTNADGFVDGEGIGAILLKPLSKAIKDNDRIYAVIKGSAINAGGKTSGYTVPNPQAQADIIANAIHKANINPRTISYVEAHGTGTSLGDPIEVSGLQSIYEKYSQDKQYCAIGSIKTNIGHLEAAAGIAGLTKILLQMKYKKICPSLNSENLNQKIDFHNSPFYVQQNLMDWKKPVINENGEQKIYPRIAALSSFGAGGANAHMIIEEYDEYCDDAKNNTNNKELVILSAKNAERLRVYGEKLLNFINTTNTNNLSDIAYTLQTGREGMKTRLALIVSNVDELKTGLQAYLTNSKFTFLYSGDVDEENDTNVSHEYLNTIIRDKNFEELAGLWIAGIDIDWSRLYNNEKKHTISLPTYPFAKKRHWIPEIVKINNDKDTIQGFHPLIDKLNLEQSIEQGISFEKRFNLDSPLVKDHIINGHNILPGAAYIEMVNAVCSKVFINFGISKITWLNPITIVKESKVVQVLLKKKNEIYHITFQSKHNDSTIIHAVAEIVLNPAKDYPEMIEIDQIKGTSQKTIHKNDIYKSYTQNGFNYGEYYQNLEKIWITDDTVLGELSFLNKNDFSSFSFHPSFLDSAFQAMIGFSFLNLQNQSERLITYAVEDISVYNALRSNAYVYIKILDKNHFRIMIVDQNGNLLVKFNKVILKQIKTSDRHNEGIQKNIPENTNNLDSCYYPRWCKVNENEVIETNNSNDKNVVIIHSKNDYGFHELLKQKYLENRVTLISPNESFYEKMKAIDTIDIVYFIAGSDGDNNEQITRSLFQVLKSLIDHGFTNKSMELKVITDRLLYPFDSSSALPYSACLSGLLKTFYNEYPKVKTCIIDSDFSTQLDIHNNTHDLIDKIVGVSCRLGEIAIRNNVLYQQRFFSLTLPKVTRSKIRTNGVYIIIGGMGRLGLTVSNYLLHNYNAKIIIIGRRAHNTEIENKLHELKNNRGNVHYVQADITDKTGLGDALQKIKSQHGTINGIIHSAISLNNKTIEEMSENDFINGLAPKVEGSIILSELIKNEPLDFVVFFSSIQSFIGDKKQSSYSAGSTFVDRYTYYLNEVCRFPVQTINWGYWGIIGGKSLSDGTLNDSPDHNSFEDFKNWIKMLGFDLIDTDEGLNYFEQILSSEIPQIMITKGDKDRLEDLGIELESKQFKMYPEKKLAVNDYITGIHNLIQANETVNTSDSYQKLQNYTILVLMKLFHGLNLFKTSNEKYDLGELKKQLSIIPEYYKLFDALLDILGKKGFISIDNDLIETTHLVEDNNLAQELSGINEIEAFLLENEHEIKAYVYLISQCRKNYPELLSGEINHMDVLFPNGSMSLVENIYKGNESNEYFNTVVSKLVENYVKNVVTDTPNVPINILEIGAGTGGTSRNVLKTIAEYSDSITYYYTDISTGFTNYGQKEFGSKYPFVNFEVLDIEKDIIEQGFTPGNFDIVIATNVIHATGIISHTLSNIKQLLSHKGLFILNEATKVHDFVTVTFGLTSGWWLFNDSENRLAYSPLLNVHMWKNQLLRNGFTNINTIKLPGVDEDTAGQHIIVSESDGIIEETKKTPVNVNQHEAPIEHVAVTEDRDTVFQKVRNYFITMFSNLLKMNPDEIVPDEKFVNYGIDSIMIRQLHAKIAEELGVKSKTLLLECQTINEITENLFENHSEALAQFTETTINDQKVRHEEIHNTLTENNVAINYRDHNREKDIAIIGIGARYPGADTLDDFWDLLLTGKSRITEIPQSRWNNADFQDSIYCNQGAFIDKVDEFDSLHFNISPAEAKIIPPEERLILEVAWNTLEDAGYTKDSLENEKVGVYMGIASNTYSLLGLDKQNNGIGPALNTTFFKVPNRISYFFNFNGPSIALDTGCSSSLAAIHQASLSIRQGECDYALVGGANLYLHPSKYQELCQGKLLSSTADYHMYRSDGDGFVPGEGIGAILLKPLDKAINDNDNIYGVIKSSTVNHKGRTNGFYYPSPKSQTNLIKETITNSNINPQNITYIETHATGSDTVDIVEWESLNKVYEEFHGKNNICALSSIKPQIGHLEAASGMAQLTKVLLQMKHGIKVPNLVADTIFPEINVENSPFYIQKTMEPWTTNGNSPRIAAINNFSAGGVEAQIIIEEYKQKKPITISPDYEIIVLSAKTKKQLNEYSEQLYHFLKKSINEIQLSDIAYTLQVGRENFKERLAFVTNSKQELLTELNKYINNENPQSIITGTVKNNTANHSGNITNIIETGNYPKIARLWVEGHHIDWEIIKKNNVRKISLPTLPFQRKKCWFLNEHKKTDQVVKQKPNSNYYSTNVSGYYNNFESINEEYKVKESYLTFAPFDEVIDGFSCLLAFFDPGRHRNQHALMLIKQKELRDVLFRLIDFTKVKKALDIGCGFSTDVRALARRHKHLICHGHTISDLQYNEGRKRISIENLTQRVQLFLQDSSKQSFNDMYDLIFGFEVFVHIKNKDGVLKNIVKHLSQDGHLVFADFIANTVTDVSQDAIGQYTLNLKQFSEKIAEYGLEVVSCVDVGQEISNFLFDKNFDGNLQYIIDHYPDMGNFIEHHNAWNNYGKAMKMDLIRYVLLTIKKAHSTLSKKELFEKNYKELSSGSTKYHTILSERPGLKREIPIEILKKLNERI